MGIREKIVVEEKKLNGDRYIFLDENLVQEAVALKLFPKEQVIKFYSRNIFHSKRLPTNTIALRLYFNKNKKVKRYERILRSYTY